MNATGVRHSPFLRFREMVWADQCDAILIEIAGNRFNRSDVGSISVHGSGAARHGPLPVIRFRRTRRSGG
jgi:hypothetical protein